ncbi:glycosyltransferase family 1 protein [bacterium]|nr:glycosyltransferase family 1 protein [bacterium]
MNIENIEQESYKIRVLHAAALLTPSSGILTQMQWEQDAADLLDIDWKVKMYCPQDIKGNHSIVYKCRRIKSRGQPKLYKKVIAWFKLRYKYHQWLIRQQNNFDVFLLRYYVHDPFQLWFLRKCEKPVYFVHHTLEVSELALIGGAIGYARSLLESTLGRFSIKRAAGLVGVTKEIVEYEALRSGCQEKKKIIYPNGILSGNKSLVDRRNEDFPEFLFVANFSAWHGLDLLLGEVARSNRYFILHLVGKIPIDLIGLTEDPRIRVHGEMTQEEIAELSECCWVGLASLALFRNNMKQACPLKVREYLMLGLPVYGDFVDVFPEEIFFFKKGSCKMHELLEFSYCVRKISKNAVRDAAHKWIDKKSILFRFYDEITENVCE